MEELNIKVSGMHCGGCEKRVVNALSEVENIEEVNANHETGIVNIKCNGIVDIETIKERIDDLGFTVED